MNNKTIGAIILILVVLIAVFFAISLTRESQNEVENPEEENIIENEEEEDIVSTIFPGEWQWEKTVYTDGEEVVPEDPTKFVVRFTEGGRFSSLTDCNNLMGNYEVSVDAQTLRFSDPASTLMYCEGSMENEYKADLVKVEKYSFSEDGLSLNLETEDGVMEFIQIK